MIRSPPGSDRRRNQTGATTLTTMLMAALVGIVAVVVLDDMGEALRDDLFGTVASTLETLTKPPPSPAPPSDPPPADPPQDPPQDPPGPAATRFPLASPPPSVDTAAVIANLTTCANFFSVDYDFQRSGGANLVGNTAAALVVDRARLSTGDPSTSLCPDFPDLTSLTTSTGSISVSVVSTEGVVTPIGVAAFFDDPIGLAAPYTVRLGPFGLATDVESYRADGLTLRVAISQRYTVAGLILPAELTTLLTVTYGFDDVPAGAAIADEGALTVSLTGDGVQGSTLSISRVSLSAAFDGP